MAKKQNNKHHILARYGCITLILFIICVAITIKMVNTTIVDAKAWNDRANRELSRTVPLPPERGSILASNGSILACNLTVYDIRIDLRHPKFSNLTRTQWESLDSLADSLNRFFPRHDMLQNPDTLAKYGWRTVFHEQLSKAPDKRRSTVTIASKREIEDYEHIRRLPFFKDIKSKGRGCPVYTEEQSKRIYPFGDMARLSIGRVYESEKTGKVTGYAGLEMALDTLLYGKPGRAKKVAMNSGISNWVDIPPVRGFDVRTTIDIDIQDMVEAELLRFCRDSTIPAEWGTAVLMEVKTGEIKAISNVEKDDDGNWVEAMNRAVQPVEPGSVVKPISMMIAFEDGLVRNVTDEVETAPFQRTVDPHAPSRKNMKQVIAWSSNTGIARVIFRGYANDPSKYYDRLKSIGLLEPMNSGIGGEQTGRVSRIVSRDSKGRRITQTAQHLNLARQAYGYNIEIPPLYTLAYFNAMANDGKLVRPHLVKSLIDASGRDSIVDPGYIREQVCSPATAQKMRECLLEVVWGKGTGNAVRDDRVKIAGKTGTCYPYDYKVLHNYDKSKRRFAFCGFFPYDNPRYSCIVLIQAPAGSTSAGTGPGKVLKNIALKLYARGLLDDAGSSYTATRKASTPVLYASTAGSSATLSSSLNLGAAKQIKRSKASVAKGRVPDVKGLDAPSAVRALEKAGFNARISGRGFVVSQSIQPGAAIKKGSVVKITLRL